MINKFPMQEEIMQNMQAKLAEEDDNKSLLKAVDYLNSAIDIFADAGYSKQADQVLALLEKIAKKQMKRPVGQGIDRHTKGLTSDKMVQNLKHHGTPFNMCNDCNDDDDLNIDENYVVSSELDQDFEDE